MKSEDVERVRTRVSVGWRPDMRCADCLGPPTCPMLKDALWSTIWSTPPANSQPRRCNCVEWEHDPDRYRPGHRVRLGDAEHWARCDLARPERRALLCLECAERRLGRRVIVDDLYPCLGNYYAAVATRRAAETGAAPTPFKTEDAATTQAWGESPPIDLTMTGPKLERLSPVSSPAAPVSPLDRLRALSSRTAADATAPDHPYRTASSVDGQCDHGVTFDARASGGLTAEEVRRRWPRLDGECPRKCGFRGIAYASKLHYVAGDW